MVVSSQGHHIWNGARVLAQYMERNPSLFRDRTILELGAGAGLPGIVAAVEVGAKAVVLTDYPDEDLIDNLRHNAHETRNTNNTNGPIVEVRGYLWGDKNSEPLFEALPSTEHDIGGFDILLMADLNFNHHCHESLAESISLTMRKSGDAKALVFFTPYRPWLLDKDMAFFDICKAKGLGVRKLLEEKMEKVMFEKDPGCEDLRKTVYGFEVTWPESIA